MLEAYVIIIKYLWPDQIVEISTVKSDILFELDFPNMKLFL